jgi:flagellar biosynthesis protein FliR
MLYYSYKEITPLKVEISKLIFKESEKAAELEKKEIFKIQKSKFNVRESKTKFITKNKKKGKNPPRKSKSRKIKSENSSDDNQQNTEEKGLYSITKAKAKKKKSKRLSKMGITLNINAYQINDVHPKEFESEISDKKAEIINAKKKAKEELEKPENKNLDNFELNNLDYDEACDFDKRGFCCTYWSVLMREHTVLFTFFTCYDYNLFYVKIERFFILICTQFTMNGLFFIHESMHRKYVEGQEFTFVQKLPQLLFTLIVSHIIEVILCCLSMTDTSIYKIKGLPKEEKTSETVLDIIDCMKRKLTTFFVFTFLLFLFYWYFISAFCAVYQNTQIIFLRDSGLSILTSFLDPFIIYGITTALRIISLSLCCKKKLGCVYKLSDIIPIF